MTTSQYQNIMPLLIVVSIVAVPCIGYLVYRSYQIKTVYSAKTEGNVIDSHLNKSSIGDSTGTKRSRVIEFHTKSGEVIQFNDGSAYSESDFGKSVKVHYNPENPEQAVSSGGIYTNILSIIAWVGLSIILIMGGGMFFLILRTVK